MTIPKPATQNSPLPYKKDINPPAYRMVPPYSEAVDSLAKGQPVSQRETIGVTAPSSRREISPVQSGISSKEAHPSEDATALTTEEKTQITFDQFMQNNRGCKRFSHNPYNPGQPWTAFADKNSLS